MLSKQSNISEFLKVQNSLKFCCKTWHAVPDSHGNDGPPIICRMGWNGMKQ